MTSELETREVCLYRELKERFCGSPLFDTAMPTSIIGHLDMFLDRRLFGSSLSLIRDGDEMASTKSKQGALCSHGLTHT